MFICFSCMNEFMCVICVHMQWMPEEGVRSLGGRGLLWGIYSLFPLRDLGIELRLSSLRDKHFHRLNHFWDHVHFFFQIFYFLMCVWSWICACGHASATALLWRSEDNLRLLSLSFYHVGLEIELRSAGLATSTFMYWAILPAPKRSL